MNKKFVSIMFILFSFFISANITKAKECVYQTAVSYADSEVLKECFETYAPALEFMNSYKSTEKEVAVIMKNNRIINAKYAIAKIDVENDNVILKPGNDGIKTVYSTSYDAYKSVANASSKNNLSYIASTWGSDAAFLEYDDNYDTIKIKISGLVGWIKKNQSIIIPISKFYDKTYNHQDNTPKLKCNSSGVTLRKEPSKTSEAINGKASVENSIYDFAPSKTVNDGNLTWYYVKNGNNLGYYASDGSWFTDLSQLKNDTYYYVNAGKLYHRIHKGENYADVTIVNGTAPFYYSEPGKKTNILNENTNYYSFDGNYFYTNYQNMIDDYVTNSHDKSINKEHPYYPYFMYLPSRSKTSYSADQFNQLIINKGYTSFPINPKSYVNASNGTMIKGANGSSMMFGIGNSLIDAQNTYGTNALIIYGNAIRESATGTSAIAFYKNNLFGMGAYDGSAFTSAKTYNSIDESVKDYSKFIGYGSSFSDIGNFRYNGTHEGNKLSGKAVFYASDPYSGESTTASVYYADIDSGNLDEFSNTIGIKNNDEVVNIYAERDETSRVIYQTKNELTGKTLVNMPFTVIDYKDGFYKVYTDLSLNANREVDKTKYYDYNVSYGYIKEEDLYVRNNAPVIKAEDQTINALEKFEYRPTATDFEDGDISSKIIMDKEVDTSIPASYQVNFSVTDSEKLTTYETITVTVKPLKTDILTSDTTVPQYKQFDPLEGVTAVDNIDGDITSNLVINNKVDTNVMGEYTLEYSVTNSKNEVTKLNRIVTVIENKRPSINAVNKVIYKGEELNPLEGVTAEDFEDGDLTSKITYVGTVDTNIFGNYSITYKVLDLENQETTKTIEVKVEEKKYISKDSIFHLENLTVKDKLFNLKGFIIIKGMSNLTTTDIKYDIIFREQISNEEIIMPLSRLTENIPFDAPNEGNFKNTGSWFNENLDLSKLNSGDYTVFIRARSGDFEAKTTLKNLFFNKNVVSKVEIDGTGYNFKTNFYDKQIPLELFVRKDGLLSTVNNPTTDNMYNQVYDINFEDDSINIKGSSHNVKGNYGLTQNVIRELYLEDINTKKVVKKYDLDSISNGPYQVSLKVSDGLSKTRVWYDKKIDLSSVPVGHYAINIRTKSGDIDDYGELYDILYLKIGKSHSYNERKYTIVRNNEIRYRIELIIE